MRGIAPVRVVTALTDDVLGQSQTVIFDLGDSSRFLSPAHESYGSALLADVLGLTYDIPRPTEDWKQNVVESRRAIEREVKSLRGIQRGFSKRWGSALPRLRVSDSTTPCQLAGYGEDSVDLSVAVESASSRCSGGVPTSSIPHWIRKFAVASS